MKKFFVSSIVALLALIAVAASYGQPPPRQAIPDRSVVIVRIADGGKACFKGTRAQLRRAFLNGTLCR